MVPDLTGLFVVVIVMLFLAAAFAVSAWWWAPLWIAIVGTVVFVLPALLLVVLWIYSKTF